MKRSEVPDNRKRFTWEEVQALYVGMLEIHSTMIEDWYSVQEFMKELIGQMICLERGYCIHGELPDDCPDCRN